MNKLRIVSLLDRLKTITAELENEIKNDPESYLEGVSYQDVVWYYKDHNDDDGYEGL